MTVIEQREPQQTLSDNEEVVGELSDGMKLIRTDDGSGIVRPPTELGRMERKYDRFSDAALLFGLWLETDGFDEAGAPTTGARQIPIDVVRAGKDAVAAYIRVGTGTVNNREYAARALDVTEQTISNYCNRVRWSDE